MERFRKSRQYILLLSLLIITIYIGLSVYIQEIKPKDLLVVFLDVGQGDAIYIEAPNGRQILIDGGGGPIVLARLARVMPFADRSIDLIIATNPDQDHIGGIVDVLENYKVGQVLQSGTKNDTIVYQKLQNVLTDKKINNNLATDGMKILLDKERNIYLDILFPDRDVSNWERNDGSVVARLVYNQSSFMLMGDATNYTENLITWAKERSALQSDVLKLGHHGSATSSSYLWLDAVSPSVAIISAGRNNRYGHPSPVVIERLQSLHILYKETAKEGNIIFKTDGQKISY